ncbi:LysM peptidoglycan-binding domain-containing protein [Maridesulfovibrio hydrothermalis]|uniref:Lytic transglycosylase catalytic n=1 Tax=Maridesulfovibrio hydrothermalis AM13 = DSM 14728 TaxID=1121451 RepID=L0R8F2_9BACT|nr:LysM peptidoglycan-binding domain-containing protein [Maridesulfovibrio hydrothermalis]CCO23029.1 Lytic transglycosylase catalytic [Maridesulfovibrio hydrothermalis AM13 = DSM 14728]
MTTVKKDKGSKMLNSLRLIALLAIVSLFAGCAAKTAPVAEKEISEPTVQVEEVLDVEVADSGVEPLDPELEAAPQDSGELTPEEEKVLYSSSGIYFNLDEHDTKEVQQYFGFFTHKARKTFTRWLKRSEPFLPYVRQVLKDNDIPEDLAMLPFAESGYNAWAYSRVGAGGMWQFMPYTGRKFGLRVDWWVDERRDPFKSTHAAVAYLKVLHNMFGDWHLALAAYNAGEGKIGRALKKTGCDNFFDLTKNNYKLSRRYRLRAETKNYVPKFIAISKIFKNLEELGFDKIDWNNGIQVETVKVPGGTDLLALAKACGLKWSEFNKLNPHFRRQVSPPDGTINAYLPERVMANAADYLESPSSRPFAGYKRYKIRKGDSWYRIANRYAVPIAVLKSVNNRKSNLIKPGQYIMIPGKGSKTAVYTSKTSKTRRTARSRANYRVRKGDTLWDIASRYKVSVRTLKRANGMYSSRLKIGQKLYIPDNSARRSAKSIAKAENIKQQTVNYRVRRGDNLSKIARRFGVRVSSLMKWNRLNSKSIIRPGDKIKVYVR